MLQVPEPRTVAFLSLLAATAVLSVFLNYGNSDSGVKKSRPELSLAYYLDQAELTGTAPDGTVLYRIQTRRAEQSKDDDSIQLEKIEMTYGAPTGVPWELHAERGRMPADASIIELEGNVVAVSGSDHAQRTEIRTQRMEIDPETMLASTNRRVLMLFAGKRLNATGMEANFITNKLELLSNVNGKFTP